MPEQYSNDPKYLRLQALLAMSPNAKVLQALRKQHRLSSYIRTKNDIITALKSHMCSSACIDETENDCSDDTPSNVGKKRKSPDDDLNYESSEWPYIPTETDKKNIINEYILDTSNNALSFVECSFCGVLVTRKTNRTYSPMNLDVSVLEKMVDLLKGIWMIQHIPVFKLFDNHYNVCPSCQCCIRGRRFIKAPLYSYANGCWLGDLPDELKDLTFLEETCIARARTTRCVIKLSTGKLSQYASHGNVCIFPQEPKNLLGVLPPPLHTLHDEVAVILVSNNSTPLTEKSLDKSPLLVRRGKISAALKWLKRYNKYYADINISEDSLADYPVHGVPENYPIQHVFETTESSTYTGYSARDAQTSKTAGDSTDQSFIVQTCGVLDTDGEGTSYTMRKLEMIKEILKNKQPFVKYPLADSDPVTTYHNPRLYACLWPCLFPYGVGLLEDDVRYHKSDGFRQIDLKRHVHYLMTLSDMRFQKHIIFPFVIMNLLQRRTSSFQSRLILKRSWFPNIVKAMNDIDVESINEVKEKFVSKTPLGNTPQENAVRTLLKYVNYMSEDISGSIGEIQKMKQELWSIVRTVGLPHIFVTINPADIYNPIVQKFCGRDIDLDCTFHEMSSGNEDLERMKTATENPAATARAFHHIVQCFTDIMLGMKRPNQSGVFGPLHSYYGVIEAQARGALHGHFMGWLKDGLDPQEVKSRLAEDETWKKQFFEWLESCFKLDLPDNTMPRSHDVEYKKKPLMCRPVAITFTGLDEQFKQTLRDILDLTGQVHEHTHTCFKHLPYSAKAYRNEDEDCRFGLPRETVLETYVDDSGHIHLRCRNGRVNGYNDICVYCLCCNMDAKYIGSGTAALAMIMYISNYIAKISLDSSVIFSCICAALRSINDLMHSNTNDGSCSASEAARLLVLKICNGFIGKRELSGQQACSFLQNIPNRYTNHKFETYWWTNVLKFISPETFCNPPDDNDGYVVLDELSLSQELSPALPGIVNDYLYRPLSLESTCLWDSWTNYMIVKHANTDTEDVDMEKDLGEHRDVPFFKLLDGHPKQQGYAVKRRPGPITPILGGIQIPRNDIEDEYERYCIMMLTLFKPWNRHDPILKPRAQSWKDAFEEMYKSLNATKVKLLKNFQAIYSCRDAADDYSSIRKERIRNIISTMPQNMQLASNCAIDHSEEDIHWIQAMEDVNDGDLEHGPSKRSLTDILDSIRHAELGGFYHVQDILPVFSNEATEGNDADVNFSNAEYLRLLKMRDELVKSIINDNQSSAGAFNANLSQSGQEPITQYFDCETPPKPTYSREKWDILLPHRRLCMHIINKFTLNEEQSLTFLIFADHYGLQHCVLPPSLTRPIRMIISGPGGTGKSQIFQAIESFFTQLNHRNRLKITAPTGLAANNVNGSTIHSEAYLRMSAKDMLPSNRIGSARSNLESKYQNVNTQIVDEVYFMSAEDNAKLSRYIGLATHAPDANYPYGNLNMIFAGDPAQLPPPLAKPLFHEKLINHPESRINAGNARMTKALNGIVIWRQIDKCVVLKQVMRQKDPCFRDLLSRLRFGNCTYEDYGLLQKYILGDMPAEKANRLLNISKWFEHPDEASPLITFTNAVRDVHNIRCAQAFATWSGQEYHEYHSEDKVSRGKITLTNKAAKAAWDIPWKKAEGLPGRLPLIPQMPIFITHNIATPLGLSNGTSGKLISVKYAVKDGLRYAISTEVECHSFKHGPEEHPNRVTLIPIQKRISYTIPGSSKTYYATRHQLPIIPAFSFTAHNAQSRSLNTACIDLESCPNTAAAYVMLSRLRSLDGLSILRPFQYSKISMHCPQEVRDEIKRLESMSKETMEESKISLDWYYNLIQE